VRHVQIVIIGLGNAVSPNIKRLHNVVTGMRPDDAIKEVISLFQAKVKATAHEGTHQGLHPGVGLGYGLKGARDAIGYQPCGSDQLPRREGTKVTNDLLAFLSQLLSPLAPVLI
jgi:hypothetical protein